MDESWRMRMGVGMATRPRPKPKPSLPRRRSTEETSARRAVFGGNSEALNPEDFSDVFGGPPRTVLSRQFSSGDFSRSSNPFYEEIFQQPDTVAPAKSCGRNLPEFRIPTSKGRSEGFYSDIFGKGNDVRRSRSRSNSKSKSKSNSSSVLSSEELSPLRPAAGEDDVSFSTFTSKLRPINVPCRWSSLTMMPDEYPWQQGMQASKTSCSSYFDSQFPESDYIENLRSSHFGFSRRVPSPETISLEPDSYRSVKVSMDDQELNSPSSVISSLGQDPNLKAKKTQDKILQEHEMGQEDDEVMSSFIIEINADHREGTAEALGIDEAIAWAKEKFHTQSSEENWNKREKDQSSETEGLSVGKMDGHGTMLSPVVNFCHVAEPDKWVPGGTEPLGKDMETKHLDEDIRMWSAGKETNIRLLLSTLHNILWPNSGWYATPLTSLIEGSQVKKAYQKARLCLHPDKLQQRGATFTQKYVADKAFSILQEAWAALISQDVVFL